MKQICILLTKYSDWISSLVYYIGGQGYTHSSIALGDQPTQFYSFNYRGFAVETTEKHRRRGVRYSRLYRLNVSDTVYERIEERIRYFLENREKYRYTRLGVLCCVSPDSIVLEESLFLFSVCGRTLIRVERAACPASRASTCPTILYACWKHSPALPEWKQDFI